ncbi:MAG TPA: hypothetical protein VHX65_10450 [Pirellulales bacterium]|jgi:hypothetical protein|nr:hypothetical protein [Pirellulales bacterium]
MNAMPKTARPKSPAVLEKAGKAFWRAVNDEFSIESDHQLRLLEHAARMLDLAAAAREIIARDGLLVPGKTGATRENPAAASERQSMNAFRLTVRELGLDIEPPAEHRGPRRPGTRN